MLATPDGAVKVEVVKPATVPYSKKVKEMPRSIDTITAFH